MARKKKYKAEEILEVAFDMACEEGLKGVSMRKIAAKLGSSVIPLYASYENREELINAIILKAYEELFKIQAKGSINVSYLDRGAALLQIAKRYPKFYVDVTSYNKDNQPKGEVINEILSSMRKDIRLKDFSDGELMNIHMKIELFIYGITMAIYSDLIPKTISDGSLLKMLNHTGNDIIMGEIKRKEEKDV